MRVSKSIRSSRWSTADRNIFSLFLFSFGPSKNDKYEQHIKHLNHPNLLSNALVGLGEALHVLLDQTVATQELDVGTVLLELALLAELDVLLTTDGGEAPVLGDNDLLATRELVGGAAHGLNGGGAVGVTGADGQEDLADVHTGDNTVGLTEGTTHTGLETIGTSARQHLVDTDDVEGVGADTQVETFLTGDLDEVPVFVSHMIISLHSDFGFIGSHTCWHRYGQLRELRRKAVRIRWRPCGRTGGSRPRKPSYDPSRRYGSWGREHHG